LPDKAVKTQQTPKSLHSVLTASKQTVRMTNFKTRSPSGPVAAPKMHMLAT
jgi:hypothetical protein